MLCYVLNVYARTVSKSKAVGETSDGTQGHNSLAAGSLYLNLIVTKRENEDPQCETSCKATYRDQINSRKAPIIKCFRNRSTYIPCFINKSFQTETATDHKIFCIFS